MTFIEKIVLKHNAGFIAVLATIEQPDNCKAFLPMHRNVYNRNKETKRRIIEGEFYINCKESLLMNN